MFFVRIRVSAYASLFSKWLRGTLFEKRLCFKPKYIHFVFSFVFYVTFSSCLCSGDQLVVSFFPTRSTKTCLCHGKWSFFGSSVFGSKESVISEITIRFWILPKKRTLKLSTYRGCITSALQVTTTLGLILLKACLFCLKIKAKD